MKIILSHNVIRSWGLRFVSTFILGVIFITSTPVHAGSGYASWDLSSIVTSSHGLHLKRTITCSKLTISGGGIWSLRPISFSRVVSTYTVEHNSIYVDDSSTSADYSTIQDAVDAASDGQTIYVCPGTYNERPDIEKDVSLISLEGADNTVIDANGTGDGNVVYIAGSVTINGFTITGAHADYSCFYGGGIKIAGKSGQTVNYPIIENNKIISNTACKVGGIYLSGFDSSTGDHVDNTAIIRNNIIADNLAHTTNAGGMMISCDSMIDSVIENNVFAGNESVSGSGGIELTGSSCSVTVKNNILYDNVSSGSQNAISDYSGTADISYNDSYGNTVNYSGGTGNITSDPLFVDETDYQLDTSSPCENTGDPDSAYNDVDGTRNDIGAYGGPSGDW